jgi:hypothetical protein
MQNSIPDYLGNTLINWWWVVLFILICLMAYEHSANNKNKESIFLLVQLKELQVEKENALMVHDELLRQINSQSDPAWIELSLMKVLGLTPEGQTKVFFNTP